MVPAGASQRTVPSHPKPEGPPLPGCSPSQRCVWGQRVWGHSSPPARRPHGASPGPSSPHLSESSSNSLLFRALSPLPSNSQFLLFSEKMKRSPVVESVSKSSILQEENLPQKEAE